MKKVRTTRKIAVVLGLLVPALAASGEVRVTTMPDGSKLVYNVRNDDGPAPQPTVLARLPDGELGSVITTAARRAGVSDRLVRAVIQVESAYDPRALSHKGAMGLMQLMPETAVMLAVNDPYDPVQNLQAGTAYLRRMLDRFGRLEIALAAYNAGPTAVERYDGIPPYPETRNFVRRVLALYRGTDAPLPESRAARRVATRKPIWVRDANGRLVLTTDPPESR